jgi:ABC-type bacteriocin/lantibiotic exporter with double-glycine peptidase domain
LPLEAAGARLFRLQEVAMKSGIRLAGTAVALLLCAGLLESAAAQQSPGVWLDVPFVKQQTDGCGSASIAMVMQYWLRQQNQPAGPGADAGQIQRILYSQPAHGIYASDLEHYLQQHGFQTYAFRGDWDTLRHHLEKGRPLIVALKPGSGNTPLHYEVVVGLEGDRDLLLANDPAGRKLLKQDWPAFESQWTATGKWTLLAVPRSGAR